MSQSNLPPASGVFVTLKSGGHLRGCLGTLDWLEDLASEVARFAANAASEDPRFPAVTTSELGDVTVEISVLGPLERIDPITTGGPRVDDDRCAWPRRRTGT